MKLTFSPLFQRAACVICVVVKDKLFKNAKEPKSLDKSADAVNVLVIEIASEPGDQMELAR